MLDLSSGFVERGYNVDLVVAHRAHRPGEDAFPVPDRVRVVYLGARKTLGSFWALARYLREEHPDVLLSRLDHANFVAALACVLARTKTRLVVTQASTFSANIRTRSVPNRMLEVALARFSYFRADAVICVSQGVKDDLLALGLASAGKLQVIYNPTITDDIFALAAEPVSHPWFDGSCRCGPVLLSVGNLREAKDLPTLFHAVARLKMKGIAVRLVVLGEGPLRARLEALRSELELDSVIDLPGFDPNPFPAMAKCDAYVLSSSREGLPNALIQAAALGAPVVATDCRSGPSEIVARIGTGKLVPVGDVSALTDVIASTVSSPGSRLVDSGGDFSTFTPMTVIPKYLKVLGAGDWR